MGLLQASQDLGSPCPKAAGVACDVIEVDLESPTVSQNVFSSLIVWSPADRPTKRWAPFCR